MEQSRFLLASCSNVADGHWPCMRKCYVLSRNFCKRMRRITEYLGELVCIETVIDDGWLRFRFGMQESKYPCILYLP
jgi:hypothetical protein